MAMLITLFILFLLLWGFIYLAANGIKKFLEYKTPSPAETKVTCTRTRGGNKFKNLYSEMRIAVKNEDFTRADLIQKELDSSCF